MLRRDSLSPIDSELRLHYQVGSFGETALPTIKREKGLRTALERQSNMEQVNCALPLFPRVFVAQLIGQPENIRPADPGVNQQPGLQILFQSPEKPAGAVIRSMA
jgi:hypothetical protein